MQFFINKVLNGINSGFMKLILCVLVLNYTTAFAQTLEQKFTKANQYYKDKQYDFAESAYLEILKTDAENVNANYNIGNVYFHKKEYVNAVYYYEKANKFKPDDKAILHNLQMTNNLLFKKQEFSSGFFLTAYLHQFIQSYTSAQWAKIALFFLWMAVVGLIFYFVKQNLFARRVGILSALMACLFFLFTYIKYNSETKKDYGILMQTSVLNKTPVLNADTKDTAQAGTKLKLIDTDKDWQKVQLPNDKQGWIMKSAVKEI